MGGDWKSGGNMWAFIERRYSKRYKIEWDATLHCVFPDCKETLQVRVVEVSLTGGRLAVEKLQVGGYHLFIGNSQRELNLSISLPKGLIETPVEIRWYKWDEVERNFDVGVEFMSLEKEERSILKDSVKNLDARNA
jgi:c-di-GMP-binding flagellar brake protein YcgR